MGALRRGSVRNCSNGAAFSLAVSESCITDYNLLRGQSKSRLQRSNKQNAYGATERSHIAEWMRPRQNLASEASQAWGLSVDNSRRAVADISAAGYARGRLIVNSVPCPRRDSTRMSPPAPRTVAAQKVRPSPCVAPG